MNTTVSDTIRVARILCILLLVYAHAQPYTPGIPSDLLSQEGVIYFLRLLLGHASVPLLSLVSGYLLAQSLQKRPFVVEVKHKLTTLIVPLVLWNLIYIFKEFLESRFTTLPEPSAWPNALLALTDYPVIMPLYFLRDSFVCFLISPVLIYLAARAPLAAIVVLLSNALVGLDGPLFINSAIPLFYFAGCLLQTRNTPISTHSIPASLVTISWLVMVALSAAPILSPVHWGFTTTGSLPANAADIVLRAAGCIGFWHLACWLRDNHVGSFLMRYEPIAFFIFCTHGMVAGVWWMLFRHLGWVDSAAAVFSYFVSAPLLVLITSVAVIRPAVIVAPKAMQLLFGGRTPSREQLSLMFKPFCQRLASTPK